MPNPKRPLSLRMLREFEHGCLYRPADYRHWRAEIGSGLPKIPPVEIGRRVFTVRRG